jgi:hypothetical protein
MNAFTMNSAPVNVDPLRQLKRETVLSRYELAVFSTLAALMVTVTLVLLNIGFRVQMPA